MLRLRDSSVAAGTGDKVGVTVALMGRVSSTRSAVATVSNWSCTDKRLGWKSFSLTLRLPVCIDVVTLELDASDRTALGDINNDTGLGEGVERSPKVTVLVDTNTLGKPRHLREVIGRRTSARDHLLAVDPDVDRLDVGARKETVLGGTRTRNTVDLGDGAVVACVASEDVTTVLEPVLLGVAKADDGNEAVSHLASAGVNVHGIESDSSTAVGGVATDLTLVLTCG